MPSTSPHLDRFLAALHRRLLVVFLLEQTGLGILAGSVVAGVLIPLLLWAGRPALEPTLSAVAVGALIGFVLALQRRPTRLAAAAEADRQLALADLLSTALSVGPRSRESDRDADAAPWLASVTALADAACRNHSPSQVILRRRSARAWTGIALSAALATTVAALVNESPRAGAATDDPAQPMNAGRPRGLLATEPGPPPTPANVRRPAAAQPSSESSSGIPRALTSDDKSSATNAAANASRPTSNSHPSASGSSTGTAPGNASATRTPDNQADPARVAAAVRSHPAAMTPSGGAGPSTTARTATGDAAPTGTASGTAAGTTPPWQSDTWAADVRRAREAVDAGRVPAAHHDLVREYFSRGP